MMKIPLQYVNDAEGNVQAVQIPIEDWARLTDQMRRYEQMLKLKKDLLLAMGQVDRMRKGTLRKRTLKDLVDGL
ncbi:MAG: hypothetical protein J5I62_11330 [Flavobacteriales bacterium]|nr:hypothetical protein [Flavobacteriales bacterium]MEB2342072.1 hypothetical protein [Flavobacteriia bacterium]